MRSSIARIVETSLNPFWVVFALWRLRGEIGLAMRRVDRNWGWHAIIYDRATGKTVGGSLKRDRFRALAAALTEYFERRHQGSSLLSPSRPSSLPAASAGALVSRRIAITRACEEWRLRLAMANPLTPWNSSALACNRLRKWPAAIKVLSTRLSELRRDTHTIVKLELEILLPEGDRRQVVAAGIASGEANRNPRTAERALRRAEDEAVLQAADWTFHHTKLNRDADSTLSWTPTLKVTQGGDHRTFSPKFRIPVLGLVICEIG